MRRTRCVTRNKGRQSVRGVDVISKTLIRAPNSIGRDSTEVSTTTEFLSVEFSLRA
jgi:hypothetical protein